MRYTKLMSAETITFRGVKFRRYPNAQQASGRRYYVPGIADRQRGVKRLHEEIWMAHNGPIPPGHHVHHRDHDHLNNDAANLDCIPDDEHRALHAAALRGTPATAAQAAHLARIRPAAAAWHSSPEGLAWHVEHGAASWVDRETRGYLCERCGAPYESRSINGRERFCSNRCRAAARRASGADDEDRACVQCGTSFRINRYAKSKTCSRSCGMKWSCARRGLNSTC